MNIKFLAIGDLHLATRQISSRKDDYFETCKSKLLFCLKQAVLNKVSAIIFTGDIFHDKDESAIDTKAIHALLNFISQAKKFGIKVISVIGNHDMKYHDPDVSLRNLGLLERSSDNFILVDHSPVTFEQGDKTVIITGTSFTFHGDKGPLKERIQYFPKKQNADFHIHVTHGSQMPRTEAGSAPFMEITESEDILKENPVWDLNINGHIHLVQQKVVSYKGKYILNPCSLTRGSLSMDNITRDISISLIEIPLDKQNFEPKFTHITVPAKKPEEIFDVNSYLESKELDKKVQNFLEMLRETSVNSDNSNNRIEQLIDTTDFDSKIKERAKEYVNKLDA